MNLMWLTMTRVKYKELFEEIKDTDKKIKIFTPNPEIIIASKSDSEFRDILNSWDYLLPDWIWLYIAFQVFSNNLGKFANILLMPYFFFNLFVKRKSLYEKFWERVCGSDLTRDLLNYANTKNWEIVILDLYNPTDLKKVESQKILVPKLQEKFPNIKINFFVYEESKKEEIIAEINKIEGTAYVFVTLGAKKQEKLINEIFPSLTGGRIWLGIGSSIDYLIWFQKRAPKAFRSLWLEWLYRLITGPQKINRLKRIYTAIFVFLGAVLNEKK